MKFWRNRRVLVTGGGGFIGSNLVERLVTLGAKPRAFVHYNALGLNGWLDHSSAREDVEIVAGDIGDPEFVRRAVEDCEYVFHLAALIAIPYSYVAPRSYVRTNVEGTLNVMQAAHEAGVKRVIHTSTSEVYGSALRVPIDEAHPLQGQSPYSASKIGADKVAESFFRSFELPVVTIRPFNTFGPRQSARAVIPTIIGQCLTHQRIRLGNLRPTRDLNYVSNTVDGFVRAAEAANVVGETINLGSGREISVGELAKLIARLTGSTGGVESVSERLRPENSEVDRLLADHTKAQRLLGWQPAVALEEGLDRTIAWMRDNLGKYRTDRYVV